MEEDELSRTFCGSTVYAAPEILAASDEYNAFYSDVWSCGIILYAMLTAKAGFKLMILAWLFFKSTILMVKLLHHFENHSKLPFSREKLTNGLFAEGNFIEVPQLPSNISEMASNVIRGILLYNPSDRLKLKVITEKKHEWYSANAIHKIIEAQLHENN